MDNCKVCNKKFHFWNVYKSYWKGYQEVICVHCGATHSQKRTNRLLFFFVLFIPQMIYHTVILLYEAPTTTIKFLLYFLTIFVFFGFIISLLITPLFRFKLVEKTDL
jgi:CXXC-20-CXXC protein